jgi:nucleoid DNA-binding protein
MKCSKKDLVARIQKRLGGTLPRRDISDAVAVLFELLEKDVVADRAVSVHNFGTLSPYLYPSRWARDVVSQEMRYTSPVRTVKFHAHVSFTEIVNLRRRAQTPAKKRRRRKKS